MELLGLNSRYAILGVLTALITLMLAGFASFGELRRAAPSQHQPPRSAATVPEAAPCFTVTLDREAPQIGAGRPQLFGTTGTDGTTLLRGELEAALLTAFSDKIRSYGPNCFEGTFTVSFSVDAEGKMGPTMLVHHLSEGTNFAGSPVLQVLENFRRRGHVWFDGAAPAGEVSIPLRFRLA